MNKRSYFPMLVSLVEILHLRIFKESFQSHYNFEFAFKDFMCVQKRKSLWEINVEQETGFFVFKIHAIQSDFFSKLADPFMHQGNYEVLRLKE